MTWIENLLDKAGKIDLGEQAVMLEDRQELLKRDRQSVAAAQQKFLGKEMPDPEPDEDGMGVHVGDSNVHNYPPQPRSGMNPWLAGAIGAGLLASGVGIPLGASFIANAIKGIPAASQGAGDGNTKYRLNLLP
jgi:hypothetical protein